MNKYIRLLVVALMALPFGTLSKAETLTYSFQGDAQSLDPHSMNELFTLGLLGNVYEGLTKFDSDLSLVPALATSWDVVGPRSWNIKLRENVTFHNGNSFTAEDVVFSWKRALTEGSDQKARAAMIDDIKVIDDHSIQLMTKKPIPLLMQEMAYLFILDSNWATENNTMESSNIADTSKTNFASFNANGTGPFQITKRDPGVRTVFERFNNYWDDTIPTNLTEVELVPIVEPSTRVAALLSGAIDLAYPVLLQDWDRIEKETGVHVLAGPELRTIYLGLDTRRDELLYSSVKGTNPLKDVRVRQAFAHAINLDAIVSKIMSGKATATGLMIAPQVNGFTKKLNTPYEFDPLKSKTLLQEAGYPNGFEITLDCPNDRYVNDEKICIAIASMLAKVGIDVSVLAQPKARYFAKVGAHSKNDTSMYLIGWTPITLDAHNVFNFILSCPDKETNMGVFNYGGYCNKRIDEITSQMGVEMDTIKRQALIEEGFEILKREVGFIPLHQQPLSWGVADHVTAAQRADNVLDFRHVVINR